MFDFCIRCGSHNPAGSGHCTNCSSPTSAEGLTRLHGQHTLCEQCSAELPGGDFCPGCGTRVAAGGVRSLSAFGKEPTATMGSLRITYPDGSAGPTYALPLVGNMALGRTEGDLKFGSDHHMSPLHLELEGLGHTLRAVDAGTLNGTFLRVAAPHVVTEGAVVVLGRQVLRVAYRVPEAPIIDKHGTVYVGSEARAACWFLERLTSSGGVREVYALPGPVSVGRNKGDIVFPADVFMSAQHARFEPRDDSMQVVDLTSSNGTWVRLTEPHVLQDGSQLLIGRTRLTILLPQMDP